MDCTQVLDCSDLEEVTYNQKVEVGKLKIKNEEFTVFSGKNTIGRDPEFCSIVLNNMTLSKEHAVIEVAQSNSHVIYDLGSKNKTKLGKVGLAPHVRYFLPHKTVLQFGEVLAEYIILEETGNKHTVEEDSDDDMIPATPVQPSKFAPELSSNSASPTLFEISTQCDCGTPETCGKLLGEPCGIDSTGKQTSKEADLDPAANGGDCPILSKDLVKERKCDEVKRKDVCVRNCTPLKEIAANKIDCSLNKISVEDEDSLTDDEIYCAATQIVSPANQDFKESRQSDGILRSTIDETLNSSFLSDSSVRCDTKQSLDRKSVSSRFEEYIETDFKKPAAKRNTSSTEKPFENDLKLVESGSKQNEVNNLEESVLYVNSNQNKPMDKQNINKSFDSKNVTNCGTRAENKLIPEVSVEVKIEYSRKDMQKNINVSTTHEVISPSNDLDKNFDKPVVDVEEEAIDIYNACTQVVNALDPASEKTPDRHVERNGEVMPEDIHNAATQVLTSTVTVFKESDRPVERSGGEEGQDIYNAATQVLVSSGSVVEKSSDQHLERTGEERAKDIHNVATQVLISPNSVSKRSTNSSEKELSILTKATSEVSPNHYMTKSEGSGEQNDDLSVVPTQILPSVVKISCKKEEIDIEQKKDLNKQTFNNPLNNEESNQELKDKKSHIEGDTDQVDESFFCAPTQVINHDIDLEEGSGDKSPLSNSSTYSSIHEEPTQCMDEIATPTALRITASDNAGVTSASNLPSEACKTVGALLPISSSSSANVNSVVMELFSPTQVVSHDTEVEERLVKGDKSPLSTSSTYSSIHEESTQCMDEFAASVPGINNAVVTSPILPSRTYEEAGTSMPFMSRSAANVNNVVVCGATSENHDRVDKASPSDGVANESMDLIIPSSDELIKVSKTIYGNTSDSETEKNSSPIIRTRSLRSSNFRNRQKVKRCLRSIKDSDLELSISSSEETHGRKNPDINNSQVPLCRRSSRKVANQEQNACKEIENNKLKNLKITKEKNLSVPKSTKEKSSRGESFRKLVSNESSNRPSRLRKMTWKMREASHSPAADDSKLQSASEDVEANSKERKIGSVPLKNDEQIFQSKSVSDNHSKSSERGHKFLSATVFSKCEGDSNILPVDSRTKDELMVEEACSQNKKETSSKKKGKKSSRLKSKKPSQENLDKPTKRRDSIISSKSPPRLSENTFSNLKNNIKSFQDDLSAEKKSTRRSTRSSDVETSTHATDSRILTYTDDHRTMTRQRRNTIISETAGPTAMQNKREKTVGRLGRRISSSVSVAVEDNDTCPPALSEECEGSLKKDNPMRKSSRIEKESTNLVSKKEKAHNSHAAKLKDLPNEISVSNEVEKEKSVALKRTGRKSVRAIVPLDAKVISSRSSTVVEKCNTLEKSVALKRSSRKSVGAPAPLDAEVISSRSSKIVEKCENAIGIKKSKTSYSDSNRITTSTTCDSTNKLDNVPGSPVIQTRTRKFLKKDNENSSEKACRSKRSSAANKEKLEDCGRKSSTSKKSPKSVYVTSSSCDENNESTISVNSKVKRQRLKKIAEEDCISTPARNLKRNVQSESTESLSSVGESTPKRSCRLSQKPEYHVLYTGLPTSKEEEKAIKKLGGKFVKEVEECSVLVTDKVRRTLKFLCMLAQGKPIVSKDWMLKSQRIGHFLDPWDFIVEDKEAEKKYKFQLKVSLKKATMKKLLDGYFVYATPSISPSPSEMKDIIEYSGGTFLSQEPPSSCWPEKSFVIASIDDKRLVTKFKKKSINIVTAEFILSGVLQQKLNFNEYVLTC